MQTRSFLNRARLLIRSAGKGHLPDLHTGKDFHALLERERSRVDRNGREFSVVIFNITEQEALTELIAVLKRRRRSNEEAGWLQEGKSIGVILPDTALEGAWTMAQDVLRLTARKGPAPGCHVFTYPSDWPNTTQCSDKAGNKNTPTLGSALLEMPLDRFSSGELENILSVPLPFWKRGMDLCGAAAAIILTAPLFLLIAGFIKVVSPGPVFFKQERIGHLGRPFTCLKFRTMHTEASPAIHEDHVLALMTCDAPLKKLDPTDGRIIKGGRILRQAGLDELPQLINVLRGEMSLVGPRPDLPYSVEHYHQWQGKRVETRPGLTGLWQVSGKNQTTHNEMIRLDISYVKHRSLWLDTMVMLLTVPAIILQVIDSP